MKRSPRPRRTAELPKSLNQQLNMYALAASAAEVSAFVPINPSYPASYFTNNPAGPEGPGDNGDPD